MKGGFNIEGLDHIAVLENIFVYLLILTIHKLPKIKVHFDNTSHRIFLSHDTFIC